MNRMQGLNSRDTADRSSAAAEERLSVVFVLTHNPLGRVWERVAEKLATDSIELQVVIQARALDWQSVAADLRSADAAYLDITRHLAAFDLLIDAAQHAGLAVPAGIETQAAWPAAPDRATQLRVAAYLKAGTADDLANAVRCLLHRAGKLADPPTPPGEPVLYGVYHPAAERVWSDAALAVADDGRPVVALTFDRSSWLNGDLDWVDRAIHYAEDAGLQAVAMFCDWEHAEPFGSAAHPLRRMIEQCGGALCAIWNAIILHRCDTSDAQGPFAVHGVPVFQLVRHWGASADDWRKDAQGLSPLAMTFSLTRPEMLGCIDPSVVACSPPARDGAASDGNVVEPLDEQLARPAGRSAAWARLRTSDNAGKRVAVMLHNPPCKSLEATIGNAGGLDALHSVVDLLRRLRAEGYVVGDIPRDGRALLEAILQRKAISEFRWTSVDEIVAKGGALAEIDGRQRRRPRCTAQRGRLAAALARRRLRGRRYSARRPRLARNDPAAQGHLRIPLDVGGRNRRQGRCPGRNRRGELSS